MGFVFANPQIERLQGEGEQLRGSRGGLGAGGIAGCLIRL